ncbi:MAG: DinB family protein [Ginsengibacter sp.]
MKINGTITKMVFDRWYASIKNCDTLLNSLTDEQLQKEIVPGKNRGVYLLGHLIAVHDNMLILLDMGDKLYPGLYEPFLKSPDKTFAQIPSVKELRTYWTKHCEALTQKFEGLQPADWFQKHTAVSAEDFLNEPHRNKLNIIITRTTHLAYHTGQLVLLK